MELLWKIESIYSGHEVTKNYEYNTICDPHDLSNKRYTAELSRYPISYRNVTQLYEVNYDTYINLMMNIKVDQLTTDIVIDLVNQRQPMVDKKVAYAFSNNVMYIHTPNSVKDLLYSNCYTPLGLLALRLRKSYNDNKFKKKIETDLLNVSFNRLDESTYVIKREYLQNNLEYCDLLSIADSLPNYPKSIQDELYLVNPYIFKWRD